MSAVPAEPIADEIVALVPILRPGYSEVRDIQIRLLVVAGFGRQKVLLALSLAEQNLWQTF